MPDDAWISEIMLLQRDNGISTILSEGVPTIEGVCYCLCLLVWSEVGVNCHNAIGLLGKETGCIVDINDDAS